MTTIKDISKYNLNTNTITFKQFKFYIILVRIFDSSINKNEICNKIKDIYHDNKFISKYREQLRKFTHFYKIENEYLNINEFYFKSYIENYKSNLLLLTNDFIMPNFYNTLVPNNNYDICLFKNEQISYEERMNFFNKINSIENINTIYFNLDENTTDILNSNKISNKYTNIIINEADYLKIIFPQYYNLTQIPNFLFMIIKSLQLLEKSGNLIIPCNALMINKTINKLIRLLANTFKDIQIIEDNSNLTSNILIICKKYQENISNTLIKKLINIHKEISKYNYTGCQFMEYFYHTAKTSPDKQFMYPLDIKDLDLPRNVKYTQKSMPIVDDIPINPKKNRLSERVILQLKGIFDNYFDELHFRINQNITQDEKGKITVNTEFIDKLLYEKIIHYLEIFQKNNIPYNKAWLAYINKYNKSKINTLFAFNSNIKQTLIKYGITSKYKIVKHLDNLSSIKSYHYSELDEIHNEFLNLKLNRIYYLKSIGLTNTLEQKRRLMSKILTEGVARGVSKYVLQNYDLSGLLAPKVSNGFIKLWEMYNTFNIVPNKKKIKVFHLAEAPGQWINCTHYFILTKRHKVEDYDWRATSLNPNNKENIEKYGTGIFGARDEYGFLKKFKKRWVWGSDDTGDITRINNIKWYRQYCQKWVKDSGKVDLVLGDGGIDTPDISIGQKLEYSQVLTMIGVASYGSNCVIKHFLPFLRSQTETYTSSGFYVNLIYLYYLMFETVILTKPMTSNPNSSEFYVIGKSFRGISDEHFNKLLDILRNFKINQCIFAQKEIPTEFVNQAISFYNKIIDLNINNYELRNDIYNCLENDKIITAAIGCDKYTNPKYLNDLLNKKNKEWVKEFKFE